MNKEIVRGGRLNQTAPLVVKGQQAKPPKDVFTNFAMTNTKVDISRIDFGELGQEQLLKGVINKLEAHQKIKKITADFEAAQLEYDDMVPKVNTSGDDDDFAEDAIEVGD